MLLAVAPLCRCRCNADCRCGSSRQSTGSWLWRGGISGTRRTVDVFGQVDDHFGLHVDCWEGDKRCSSYRLKEERKGWSEGGKTRSLYRTKGQWQHSHVWEELSSTTARAQDYCTNALYDSSIHHRRGHTGAELARVVTCHRFTTIAATCGGT